MSYTALAIIELLAVVAGIPAIVLGIAFLLGGRPAWLGGGRRAEPGIQSFLVIAVLTVVAVAMAFLVPFAASFGVLRHRESAALGLLLGFLVLGGVGYAWRRGVLRWD